jgi:hypothetical protein
LKFASWRNPAGTTPWPVFDLGNGLHIFMGAAFSESGTGQIKVNALFKLPLRVYFRKKPPGRDAGRLSHAAAGPAMLRFRRICA